MLHSVTPVDERTNEYNLTIQVPVQVSHSFDVSIILSHQFASKPKVVHLRFQADQDCSESSSWLYSSATNSGSNAAPYTTYA